MNSQNEIQSINTNSICTSCTTNYTKLDNRKPYNAKGLAYIFNNKDYENKLIKGELKNDLLQISHQDLKLGTMIRLINPKQKIQLSSKILKKQSI